MQTFANNNASTIYHSLQLFAEKRFSNGVSALVSYTKSKLIGSIPSVGGGGEGANLADFRIGAYNQSIDRAIDPDDVSQRVVTSKSGRCPSAAAARSERA